MAFDLAGSVDGVRLFTAVDDALMAEADDALAAFDRWHGANWWRSIRLAGKAKRGAAGVKP